jgi:hypothetical protein
MQIREIEIEEEEEESDSEIEAGRSCEESPVLRAETSHEGCEPRDGTADN